MPSQVRRRESLSWVGLLGALTCAVVLAGCGVVDGPAPVEAGLDSREDGLSSVKVRLMAGNLTSGNGQDYDLGHGIRIFQGAHPDIVMIQEFNYLNNTETDLRQFVDTAFGTEFFYYREPGVQIPNGVISRWPILAAGRWTDPYVSNRHFAWARIDVPGSKDLWAVSVHLLTAGSSTRNSESIRLVQYIQQNVPATDYLAIGGDFNTDSRGELSFSTLSQVVSTPGPHPVDQNGNSNTNLARSKPYDHVLVDGDLRPYQTATVLGASTYPSGLVVDTRVYSPLAELAPALWGDSGASNMQHMGVIKDFRIPLSLEPSTVQVGSPNGGESWVAGSSQVITWTAAGVTDVKLEYTLDGSTWNVLTASTPASAGGYLWRVPDVATSTAKVRLTDAQDASVTDESDGAFTLTASLQVVSPNGGESWATGSNHAITWSSSGVTDVKLEYTLDGSTWHVLTTSTPASAGGYLWTVPAEATGAAKVRVSAAQDAGITDESDRTFSLFVATPRVFMNEVLANEPGTSTAREFVELVNTGTATADLSGWTLSDSMVVRHTFASGTFLAPGAVVLVFGSSSGIPVGLPNAVGASTGRLDLGNGGDTVTLRDGSGGTVDSTTYTYALSSTDGVSMNRGPDVSFGAPFVLHNTLATLPSSPGTRVDGTAFP